MGAYTQNWLEVFCQSATQIGVKKHKKTKTASRGHIKYFYM